jgi:hypothetical protein
LETSSAFSLQALISVVRKALLSLAEQNGGAPLNEEGPAAGRCRLDEAISRIVVLCRPGRCLAAPGSASQPRDHEGRMPDKLEPQAKNRSE